MLGWWRVDWPCRGLVRAGEDCWVAPRPLPFPSVVLRPRVTQVSCSGPEVSVCIFGGRTEIAASNALLQRLIVKEREFENKYNDLI